MIINPVTLRSPAPRRFARAIGLWVLALVTAAGPGDLVSGSSLLFGLGLPAGSSAGEDAACEEDAAPTRDAHGPQSVRFPRWPAACWAAPPALTSSPAAVTAAAPPGPLFPAAGPSFRGSGINLRC